MSADELQRDLARLDLLLERAVVVAETLYGPDAAADPHRGLYIGDDEVRRLLAREPASATLASGGVTAEPSTRDFGRLAALFGLSRFELDVVLVALAPEVDLRYERVYAYLQDDVTKKRPSVELVLNLLCASAAEKLESRTAFEPDAPLLRHRIVRLAADPSHVEPPLVAHFVKPDEQIVRLLLGNLRLDPRLAPFTQLVPPREGGALDERLRALARGPVMPLRLYFHGPPGTGKRGAAESLAATADAPLLAVDLTRIDDDPELEESPGLIVREAALHGAVLYLTGLDAVRSEKREPALRRLLAALSAHRGLAVLAGGEERPPYALVSAEADAPLVPVRFDVPGHADRLHLWREALAAASVPASDAVLEALASRFRLGPGEIADAVRAARDRPLLDGSSTADHDVFAAARTVSARDLGGLARKVEARRRWSDLVLPEDRRAQLQEICDHVRYRTVVYGDWGFDRRLSLGKGLNVLFAGPPGTGKTLAAEIIASELGLELYKIDLSTVVSKYIGDTEKNLARIFSAAESGSAILFFDEADALFGKRSEVRDAHDRYANIEVGYLLQRIEEYEGVVILATNLRKNMDDAFVRRMHAAVEFPFPNEAERHRIWTAIWPEETPTRDLDLDRFAKRYELAGGNIRNIALAAAFLAAADGGVVMTEHVLRATRREYQKLGKVVSGGEFELMTAH